MDPEVVRKAEQDVLDAALEWSKEAPWQTRELTAAEQKLKIAVYLLGRTRQITGSFKLEIPK